MKRPAIGRKGVIAFIGVVAVISACVALAVTLAVKRKCPQDTIARPTFSTGGDMLDYLLNPGDRTWKPFLSRLLQLFLYAVSVWDQTTPEKLRPSVFSWAPTLISLNQHGQRHG